MTLSSVSVVIPCFGRESLALRALQSVASQSVLPDEIIIVDDGSEPALAELKSAVESLPVGRLVRTKHQGVSAARNLGASLSSGKYLAFLDSDDCWKERKLERQLDFITQHADCRACQTEEEWWRAGKRVNAKDCHKQPDGEAFLASLRLCCISPSSILLERDLFEGLGGFDPRLRVCEDYDLWLRLTVREQVRLVPEQLIVKHGGRDDQLSRSEPAIDRFRVFSLAKLLCSEELSAIQREASVSEFFRKLETLRIGAKKNANHKMVDVLSTLTCSLSADGHVNEKGKFLRASESLLDNQVLFESVIND